MADKRVGRKDGGRRGGGAPKTPPTGHSGPRVVVRFRDGIGLPYDASATDRMEAAGAGPWQQLVARFPGIVLVPLFASMPADRIRALVQRAQRLDPEYRAPDFLAWFAIEVPGGVDPDAVAKAIAAWPAVRLAYVEPPPVEPPAVNAADDPRSVNQGYLDPAPDGIDAEYAWGYAGGDGAGQALVDLEWGWAFTHEDLAALGITLVSGVNHSYFDHGTSVLGEIVARDNALGCVGISPGVASVRCVGQWQAGGGYATAQPILDAAAVMAPGDVLLLEAQTTLWGFAYVPVELEPAVFDAIRLATAAGIVVVEAAGNGAVDLDTVVDPAGRAVLDRASADFQDSGAILVGAATSLAPHSRMPFSCFGSRVDCYGWGENVDTLSTDGAGSATDWYTGSFQGTSSAAPIVAGAALIVQGLAQLHHGSRMLPPQLRAVFADPANGTPSQTPATDRIGVMPNLRAIISGPALDLAPDVYLRDFVGDTGDAHTGAISASPDVFLRPVAMANPQLAFGEGSGTENSVALGYEAEAGQDNFVYARVRNRGGSAVSNVGVTVYWAPPATLLTSNLWTLVGTTTIGAVPTGNLLTVSDAIPWPAASIPATGHYCFVALVGHALDPPPVPAAFADWTAFQQFIRQHNNVTWRNFNVVDNVPPAGTPPPGYVPLPFHAAGAPDRARKMQLEVVARLPKGGMALLEVPRELAHRVRLPRVDAEADAGAARGARGKAGAVPADAPVVRFRIAPSGRTRVFDAALPARALLPMRLQVAIPREWREYAFEVFARQLYRGEEVGRVTWRLVPPRERPT